MRVHSIWSQLKGLYSISRAVWELLGENFSVYTVRSLGILMYLPCKIVVSGLATGVNEVVGILLVSLLVRCREPISVASLVQGP